jgi:hypothetical protein
MEMRGNYACSPESNDEIQKPSGVVHTKKGTSNNYLQLIPPLKLFSLDRQKEGAKHKQIKAEYITGWTTTSKRDKNSTPPSRFNNSTPSPLHGSGPQHSSNRR